MTKTLKDFFEVYKPAVKGEKRFADKHVVVKHKDRNGNGDDVFNAKNVKPVDKSPEHGYNAGEDEAVYEQVLEETFKIKKPKEISKKEYDKLRAQHTHAGGPGKKRNYANEIYVRKLEDGDYADQHFSHADYGIPTVEKHRKSGKHYKFVHESVEQIDELSASTLGRYIAKSKADENNRRADGKKWKEEVRKQTGINVGSPIDRKIYSPKHSRGANQKLALNKLTGAARVNVKEEILDELSKNTLGKYIKAAVNNVASHSVQMADSLHLNNPRAEVYHLKKAVKRANGIDKATNKLVKEEQIDELSKSTLASYITRSAKDLGRRTAGAARTASIEGKKYTLKKAGKRLVGIDRAAYKLANEETNLQELDRHGMINHYISKTKDDPKRKTGRDLALKKKWGDKNYGLPEPRVKTVTRESVEQIDELSKNTLRSYVKKADNFDSEDENKLYKRDKGSSLAQRKLSRAYGRNVKIKATNEEVDLQELSKKTLASYINKAAVKNLAHAGSLATQAHDKDENKRKEAEGTAKKLVNKLDGIHRATKRLAKD